MLAEQQIQTLLPDVQGHDHSNPIQSEILFPFRNHIIAAFICSMDIRILVLDAAGEIVNRFAFSCQFQRLIMIYMSSEPDV